MAKTKQMEPVTSIINPNPPPVQEPLVPKTIPILEELKKAYEDYPHVYLELSLVDVDFDGTRINVNEDVDFRIQAINRGPLDMNELSLKVTGLNGTLVKEPSAIAPWTTEFEIDGEFFGNALGHNGNNPAVSPGGKYKFRPTSASSLVRDLVRIEVIGWNSDSSHLENGHTRADPDANVVYRAEVVDD
ncbi:MAG: hypothetical protein OER95_01800 [Acidimicrobiia bacterium]|nr:hypothetical protein [Acidimicrobiia bacterium]